MSKLGLASRAEARRLIIDGRVKLNGRVVRHPTAPVTLDGARIQIRTELKTQNSVSSVSSVSPVPPVSPVSSVLSGTPKARVVLFNKPRGTVTTKRDPEGRRTVFDTLGDAGQGLIAVGRLDLASTGLLIFTNDTQLANRLTDPAERVPRRYVVTVRGKVTPETARKIEAGLVVPGATTRDQSERLSATHVEIRKASNRETHLIVELVEGKNRELRRLFAAVGHEPTRIHRISFGDYVLGNLQPGQWVEAD